MSAIIVVLMAVIGFAAQVYMSPNNPNGFYKQKEPVPIVEQVKVEDPKWVTDGCEAYFESKGLSGTPCGVGSAHDTGNDPEIAFNMAKADIQKKQEIIEVTILESWVTSNGEFYVLVIPNA